MQIKHSTSLINLRGWPSPAGWNSGRPVGNAVLIYSAFALQWVIYLIGMNLKNSVFLCSHLSTTLLFSPRSMSVLCWISGLVLQKRKQTHMLALCSPPGAHLLAAHCTDPAPNNICWCSILFLPWGHGEAGTFLCMQWNVLECRGLQPVSLGPHAVVWSFCSTSLKLWPKLTEIEFYWILSCIKEC